MADAAPIPIKRLVLRAVLRDVSPIVARVISALDELEISELHDVFLSMLDWAQGPDFIIRIHAQEYARFRRSSCGGLCTVTLADDSVPKFIPGYVTHRVNVFNDGRIVDYSEVSPTVPWLAAYPLIKEI